MTSRGAFAWAALIACAGCTSRAEVREDPETQRALSACEETRARQQQVIERQRRRIAELEGRDGAERGAAAPGPAEQESAAEQGEERGPEDARGGVEIYQAFVTRLEGARPELRDCYLAALKANPRLEEREISLRIQVSYAPSGEVDAVKLSPRVSRSFAGCARGALRRLKLEPIPEAVTFTYGMRLSPK